MSTTTTDAASAPQISVVMPCFNAAATISAAVESIQGQSFRDWEMILFDDGSTDDTVEAVECAAQRDSRIRVMRSPHVGIVAALQKACAEARGSYLARMDADDVAHPSRLEKQLTLMQEDGEMAICGTLVNLTGPNIGSGGRRYEAWINGLVTHEAIVREMFVECPIPHPTFFVRREAFEAVGGYEDHGWPEDYDLCLRFHKAGMRFGKVAEPLLAWTNSPGRLSMTSARYSPAQFRAVKRHYLGEGPLAGDRPFHQWGAGEVGKLWLREWEALRPSAVVDINPRKIGRIIHGFEVVAPEDLPAPGETFIIIAVGAPGARREIREWLEPRGYHETRDYTFVA